MLRAAVATLTIVLGIESAVAQRDCGPYRIGEPTDSPPLTGSVHDEAQRLSLTWNSSVLLERYSRSDRSRWSIHNAVCNNGPRTLVVSWPKASIYVSAYLPISPQSRVANETELSGAKPIVDPNSPIAYGLLARLYKNAETYQRPATASLDDFSTAPVAAVRGIDISSELRGTFEPLPGLAVSVMIQTTVEPVADGFNLQIDSQHPGLRVLITLSGTPAPEPVPIIATGDPQPRPLQPDERIPTTGPELDELRELFDVPTDSSFVQIPVSSEGNRRVVFVPTRSRRITLATLAIFSADAKLLLAGRAAVLANE